LKEIGGIPKHQSAYCRGQSTETEQLKVMNDLLQSGDCGEVFTALCLDLSVALDTVAHYLSAYRPQSITSVPPPSLGLPVANP